MPRRSSQPEVSVRQLAPAEAEQGHESGLYRPVPQLDSYPPPFKVTYPWFTPEKAREWLNNAEAAADFRQRPVRLSQVRRWRNLVQSERFVHFLPNTPVCVDEEGISLNGQHRFLGLAGAREGTKAGFMVVENVPRWMFAFFDTNSVRTLKDVYHIGGRQSGPQTPSITKLAMRYEEFLTGLRNPGGWRHWNLVKDEHQDNDSFFARRQELQDWYAIAENVKKHSRILVPATAVFAFYQSLAWPGGDPELHDFLDLLVSGDADKITGHPVRKLREWTLNTWMARDQVFAKRETHLMLLFQTFGQMQRGSRIDSLKWAYGQPMTMPYHPKGHEVAVKNARVALEDIDRNFDEGN